MMAELTQRPGARTAQVRTARQGLRFVLDENLGLRVADAPWADFLAHAGIAAEPSVDLVAIDRAIGAHRVDLAFIPAADYHRFSTDPGYRGLAIATSARTGQPVQASVLVVRHTDPASTLEDLIGSSLGYVNASCSSSYFAPALLAARHGRRLNECFSLVLTPPWQAQIDAVIAGEARATMVLEDIWLATPGNAERTRIVDRVDGLAPPVVLARADLDPALADAVLAELLSWRPPAGAVYGPFIPFDEAYVAPFFQLLAALPSAL
jgi:phosphonate transport system substrate-binding protein